MNNKIIKNTIIKKASDSFLQAAALRAASRSLTQSIALFTALTFAPFTSAAMVSLDVNDILGFSQINYSGGTAAQTSQTNIDVNGVTFITFWVMGNGQASADIGSENLALDWSAYDTFSQSILNHDENPWSFSLSASDGLTTVSSNPIVIAEDEEQALSVSLSSLANVNNIVEVYVTISADLPLPGNDTVSEYNINFQVNEVPLPASAWFFSLSLATLVIVRRGSESSFNKS